MRDELTVWTRGKVRTYLDQLQSFRPSYVAVLSIRHCTLYFVPQVRMETGTEVIIIQPTLD